MDHGSKIIEFPMDGLKYHWFLATSKAIAIGGATAGKEISNIFVCAQICNL
jgi:hypothetical protein